MGLLPLLFTTIILSSACKQSDELAAPKGYANEAALKVAYALGTLKLIETEPAIPAHVSAYQDLLFKQTPEKDLKLDLYHLADLQTPQPLLVFIHGGSWKSGKKDDYRRYLLDYAEKGYVTASVSYRFSQEAPFPAALDDVVCALSWLISHADTYQIDPEKIALIGGSAGAHLGMMLAYHAYDSSYNQPTDCVLDAQQKVRAIVNLYGPTDLTTEYARTHPSVSRFIGQEYSERSHEAYVAASPLAFVSPDDPPTLTFHGTIDEIVPVSQADTLHKVLDAYQVANDYHRLEGWPHTMDLGLKVNQYCQRKMDAFFETYLRPAAQ